GVDAAARTSLTLLEQSLTAARNGRQSEAEDRAFDAYMAFEPIEVPAGSKSPGVVASMEKHYADFKAGVRGGDLRGAQRAMDVISLTMPSVLALALPPCSR